MFSLDSYKSVFVRKKTYNKDHYDGPLVLVPDHITIEFRDYLFVELISQCSQCLHLQTQELTM